MRRLMLLGICLLMGQPWLWAQTGQSVKKVAILEVVDRDNAVNYGVKLLLRTSLAKAITQTRGYEGYDRVDMGAIQGEQDFQRTGMVSDAEIRKLGEMTGAAYVLVAEAAKLDESLIIVTAKILDVETAKLEKTDYEQMGINAKDMAEACRKLANRLLSMSSEVQSNGVRKEKTMSMADVKMDEVPTSFVPKGEIIYKGGKFCELDAYGFARPIGEANTKLYMGDLYNDYRKAKTTRGFGIFFMTAGSGFCLTGASLILCYFFDKSDIMFKPCGSYGFYGQYEAYYYKYEWNDDMFALGLAFASVGVVLTVVGAPMYAIPNKKLTRILEVAQEQNITKPYKTACTLDFNTQQGVGVCLHF